MLCLGTCFRASAFLRSERAGSGAGVTVTTLHEEDDVFASDIASAALFAAKGVNFASVDAFTSIEAGMAASGQSVQLG
jgi:hypothetical protein